MLNIFLHPCDVTDVLITTLSDLMIVVGVDMLIAVEIAVVIPAVIVSECVVTALYAIDLLGVARADIRIGFVTDTCAEVLACVATDLECVLSSLLE